MAGISTHALDIESGIPGAGMRIELFVFEDGAYRLRRSCTTNKDGRTDGPILPAGEAAAGRYELRFHVGDYYRRKHGQSGRISFVDVVPVRFSVLDETRHYHVPLLCSRWSCTTYRGS